MDSVRHFISQALRRFKLYIFHENENYEKPWREIKPQGDFAKLKDHYYDELSKFEPHEDVQFVNVLLLGQSASGKSSFINSCATALRQDNHVLTLAGVATPQEGSCTGRFVHPLLKLKDNRTLPVRIYDCRGLHQTKGVQTKDVDEIIKGRVKSGYLIQSENPINEDGEFFRENSDIQDRMHVIVHVAAADGSLMHSIHKDVRKQLQEERSDWIRKADVPHIVLLTRVDKLMHGTEELFLNKAVKEVCDDAVEVLGLPLNHVFPTINYFDKIHPDEFLDFLALYNLWQIIKKGNNYVENNSDTLDT